MTLDALYALVRFVLRVFFRDVEVVGADRLPAGRPLVLVANHVNGLVDPLLLMGPLPVRPRFLAKSTLWKIAPLVPFLSLVGAIPVHRRQDADKGGAAEEEIARRNEEAFAQCHEALARGEAIALFPEGKSHDEPALAPLKTGAARIVLEAEARLGPLGMRIVPVGLFFDAKGKFRSRALVRVGEPLDPAAEADTYRKDGPAAVRALTARIEDALAEVTVSYPSWEEARLLARAADLFDRPALEVPRPRTLAEGFEIRRGFVRGYTEMRQRHPERVAALADRMREYDRMLQAFDLRDDQVAARYAPQPVRRFLWRTVLRLLVHLPLAAVGTVLNWLPYRLVGLLAGRIARTQDQRATWKVFPSLVLYPVAWIAEGVIVGRWAGAWWGVATALAAPPTGYLALRFHDRRVLFWHEARAFLVLRTRRRLRDDLKARRASIYKDVAELADLYLAGRREGERGAAERGDGA